MGAKALLFGSLCPAAPLADVATLDNALPACLAARFGAPHTTEGQSHLPFIFEARCSTGECGCTSVLVRYRLLATHANVEAQAFQEGLLDGRYEGARTLVLVADA